MSNIIDDIRKELRHKFDENTRKNGQKFFKEKIQPHGVKTSVVRKTGKEFFNKIKEKDKREIFDLCEELWKSGYIEESFIACHWSHYIRKHDYDDGWRDGKTNVIVINTDGVGKCRDQTTM